MVERILEESLGGRVESMTASAQISIYPLRQEHLGPAIGSVCDAVSRHGLTPEVGAMSTMVTGEDSVIFAALADAFSEASHKGHVVMTVTISNACPVPS
jgi:uncharacterized protein YqgV (UPF0045/DUF77 family)